MRTQYACNLGYNAVGWLSLQAFIKKNCKHMDIDIRRWVSLRMKLDVRTPTQHNRVDCKVLK